MKSGADAEVQTVKGHMNLEHGEAGGRACRERTLHRGWGLVNGPVCHVLSIRDSLQSTFGQSLR